MKKSMDYFSFRTPVFNYFLNENTLVSIEDFYDGSMFLVFYDVDTVEETFKNEKFQTYNLSQLKKDVNILLLDPI